VKESGSASGYSAPTGGVVGVDGGMTVEKEKEKEKAEVS
jgi:hypothetical protein